MKECECHVMLGFGVSKFYKFVFIFFGTEINEGMRRAFPLSPFSFTLFFLLSQQSTPYKNRHDTEFSEQLYLHDPHAKCRADQSRKEKEWKTYSPKCNFHSSQQLDRHKHAILTDNDDETTNMMQTNAAIEWRYTICVRDVVPCTLYISNNKMPISITISWGFKT